MDLIDQLQVSVPDIRPFINTIDIYLAVTLQSAEQQLRMYSIVLKNPGPEVIKLFSCSTQLSMKFSPLINVKMPTIVGILTCMSGKNNILGLTEP